MKQKTIGMTILIIMFCIGIALADENCVELNDIIASWESALISKEPQQYGVTNLSCNTCECQYTTSTWGSALYYECLAREEREKEKRYKEDRDLLERTKKYGICK